jgi:hypothetical protein
MRSRSCILLLLLSMHTLSVHTTAPGQVIRKPGPNSVTSVSEEGIHAWMPSSEPLKTRSNHAVQKNVFDQDQDEESSSRVPPDDEEEEKEEREKRLRKSVVMANSCRVAVDGILRDARGEFNKTKEEILNWSPHSGAKYTDTQLGITEYVEACTRGTGGIIKARWSDFSVLERRLDETDAELNDIETLPGGEPLQYLRFVLLKVRTHAMVLVYATHVSVCECVYGCSVLERRLDETDAELNDIETLPGGEPLQYLRFVLLKVRTHVMVLVYDTHVSVCECVCVCVWRESDFSVLEKKLTHIYMHAYIHTYICIHLHTSAYKIQIGRETGDIVHTYIHTGIHTYIHLHTKSRLAEKLET